MRARYLSLFNNFLLFSDTLFTIIIIASIAYLVETPFDNRLFKLLSPNRKLQDKILIAVFSIAMPLFIFYIVSNIYLTSISAVLSIASIYLAFGTLNHKNG